MVLSSYLEHCESSPVHAVTAETAPVAADLWTKPIGLSQKSVCRQPVNYIHHRHLLLILSLEADTHFTIPRRVED